MRNLSVRQRADLALAGGGSTSVWAWCEEGGAAYCVRGAELIRLGQGGEQRLLADLSVECVLPPSSTCVGLCPVPDLSSVLLAMSSGQLLQVATEDCGQVEEVGCVQAGIAAIDISPDLELITLVTGDLKVITMTRDYLPAQEVSLHETQFGEGEQVSLGWGRKETQFHGREGKEGRAAAREEARLVEGDDRRVRVSWRGDGQMFAVSYVVPSVGEERRCVKVFSREGSLYSTSESLAGLCHPLAWRPSGAQVAVVVRQPHRRLVAFLERNGLQHGEMLLRGEGEVRELAWSCDSQVGSWSVRLGASKRRRPSATSV